MKLLVLLFASISLCAASAIPLVPGDNSHYVEGDSQYIWMPNGDGIPQLVDIKAPLDLISLQRDGSSNEYWLFTRKNPISYQLLVNGDADSVSSSNYQSDRPTNLLVHGFGGDGATDWIIETTAALLEVEDVNVIVLDWSVPASGVYTDSVRAVPAVGVAAAEFFDWLFETAGGDWNNVHLIGHSLGAHVVGNTGRASSGQARRVTGLDPAGPQWNNNANALSTDCGRYVESIHTDGGFIGIGTAISHADFYPSGGKNPQPGCLLSFCSHGRAPYLFASSVLTNHFVAQECADFSEASSNTCSGSGTLNMGNSDITKSGLGLYGLTTGSSWPF